MIDAKNNNNNNNNSNNIEVIWKMDKPYLMRAYVLYKGKPLEFANEDLILLSKATATNLTFSEFSNCPYRILITCFELQNDKLIEVEGPHTPITEYIDNNVIVSIKITGPTQKFTGNLPTDLYLEKMEDVLNDEGIYYEIYENFIVFHKEFDVEDFNDLFHQITQISDYLESEILKQL